MSFFRRGRGQKEEEVIDAISPIESHSSNDNIAFTTANDDEKGFADSTAKETKEEQIARTIEEYRKAHRWDMNMDDATLEELARTAVEHDVTGGLDAMAKIMDDSPYPEV